MATPDEERWDIKKTVVLTAFSICILTIIATVGAALYLMVVGAPVPELLQNWGGVAFGAVFGVMLAMVAEFVKA